jgi:hypothetical protein
MSAGGGGRVWGRQVKTKTRATDWWSIFGVATFVAISGYLVVAITMASAHH